MTHYAEKKPQAKLRAISITLFFLGANRLVTLANTMVIALMVIILIERGFAIGD
jgi:hypothetical protein